MAGRLRASGGWGVAEGPPSGDPQLPSPAVLEQRQARHLAASADACRSPRQCAHAPRTTCLVSEHTQVNSKIIVRPNEPSGLRGRKELLNHASALITTCP